MEISDWSDLRQFDSGPSFNVGSNNEDNEQKKEGKENQQKNEAQAEGGGVDAIAAFEITDWNDLRKFDDDHDDDWFKYQEKLMAEQYGGNFIKVKYSTNGRVAYFCELCLAECNAKKSLELHCAGMKHLKKKDMWEKEGKPQPPISLTGENGQPKGPSGESSRDRNRTRSPPSLMRKRLSPPGHRGRAGLGSAERSRYDRNREPHGYGGEYGRDMPYDRFYPRDRYYDEHDDRDRFGPPPTAGYGAPSLMDSRGSSGLSRYSPKRERGYSPVTRKDYGHGKEKRYPDYNERRPSPIRPRYYGDKRSRSPERKRSPHGSKRDRTRSPPSPRGRRSPRRSSPYKTVTPPSPPKISSRNDSEKKVNLANSPAGSLLQKLAECCVKSSEDADLALNVVAALTKSLKEYCQRNEETKLAELLMEAELKVGTVKALKAGMKMLSNFTGDSNASISPGNVFPTFLGLNHPPPQSSQQSSMYSSAPPRSGHYNY